MHVNHWTADPLRATRRALRCFVVAALALFAVGGAVRLSGSGLSIPEWPVVNGSLLPPSDDASWAAAREDWVRDQAALRARVAGGAIGMGSLGAAPADDATFRRMFLVEWSHRALAAVVGLLALAAVITTLSSPRTRERVGAHVVGLAALVVGQAVLGGVLVKSGTATHFLFLHLGIAGAILSLAVVALCRLADPPRRLPAVSPRLASLGAGAVVAVYAQIVLGALVAGSREGVDGGFFVEWPTMHGVLVPDLWREDLGVAANVFDNCVLHQWVHRWFALVAAAAVFAFAAAVRRALPGHPATRRAALAVFLTAAQVALGLANVLGGVPLLVALAHLVVGLSLLGVLVAARATLVE